MIRSISHDIIILTLSLDHSVVNYGNLIDELKTILDSFKLAVHVHQFFDKLIWHYHWSKDLLLGIHSSLFGPDSID